MKKKIKKSNYTSNNLKKLIYSIICFHSINSINLNYAPIKKSILGKEKPVDHFGDLANDVNRWTVVARDTDTKMIREQRIRTPTQRQMHVQLQKGCLLHGVDLNRELNCWPNRRPLPMTKHGNHFYCWPINSTTTSPPTEVHSLNPNKGAP